MKKEAIKFTPREMGKHKWLAEIQYDGETIGWLNWIESPTGTICTVASNATTPMGRNIATNKTGALNVCDQLQRMFEADEIGWTNVNLKGGRK